MSHKANPVQYGWTYQGSNEQSRVEFYERDGVKMDYYPTTGQQTQGRAAQHRESQPAGDQELLQCLLT